METWRSFTVGVSETQSPRAESSQVSLLLGERWPLSSGKTVFCPLGWKTRLDWALEDWDWRPLRQLLASVGAVAV